MWVLTPFRFYGVNQGSVRCDKVIGDIEIYTSIRRDAIMEAFGKLYNFNKKNS